MATTKRVFTLRLSDEVFDKIGALATSEHRSMTNYIEYVLINHIAEVEQDRGVITPQNRIRIKSTCPAEIAGQVFCGVFNNHTGKVKSQFGGQCPQTMRYELRQKRQDRWAVLDLQCVSKSAMH